MGVSHTDEPDLDGTPLPPFVHIEAARTTFDHTISAKGRNTRNKVTNHGEIPSGWTDRKRLGRGHSHSDPATLDEFLLPALKAPVSSYSFTWFPSADPRY